MGRKRKALPLVREGVQWVTRFYHPLAKRTVRLALGGDREAAGRLLDHLDRIFLNKHFWHAPPKGTPPEVVEAWQGCAPRFLPLDAPSTGLDVAEKTFYRERVAELEAQLESMTREAEAWKGSKVRRGPCPTLAQAREAWLANYVGRDPDHTNNVAWELQRFAEDFGAETLVDDLRDGEGRILQWLHGKGPREGTGVQGEAGYRNQVRGMVLRFLEDSGLALERSKIPAQGVAKVRAARGPIAWVTRDQAEAIARKLRPEPEALDAFVKKIRRPKADKPRIRARAATYWEDLWRFQVGTGLRPSELFTLARANFTPDLERLTLANLGELTLKNGPRTVAVPEAARAVVTRRLWLGDILFPDYRTGGPWTGQGMKRAFKLWRRHLREAIVAAGAQVKADCRLGRRTCGSILLRSGQSVEQVAALLGDDPETVREHYAAILPSEVDASAAAI